MIIMHFAVLPILLYQSITHITQTDPHLTANVFWVHPKRFAWYLFWLLELLRIATTCYLRNCTVPYSPHFKYTHFKGQLGYSCQLVIKMIVHNECQKKSVSNPALKATKPF